LSFFSIREGIKIFGPSASPTVIQSDGFTEIYPEIDLNGDEPFLPVMILNKDGRRVENNESLQYISYRLGNNVYLHDEKSSIEFPLILHGEPCTEEILDKFAFINKTPKELNSLLKPVLLKHGICFNPPEKTTKITIKGGIQRDDYSTNETKLWWFMFIHATAV
jgi:hypothetical protein